MQVKKTTIIQRPYPLLCKNNAKLYVYKSHKKKAFNIVIHNLYSIIKNANITEDLNNKDFSVRQIINIHNCQTKISLHLFLFTWNHIRIIQHILRYFSITYIL